MARSDDTLYMLLLRVSRIVQRAAVDLLFEIGVSPLEAWLLEVIPDDGRACASELAEQLEVPTSTVTRALRRMEGYGYITLTKGFFFDARVLRAEITPLGIQVRSVASGFEQTIDAMLLKGFPPNAFGPLLHGLSHIEKVGRQALDPPPAPTP
jgi:DNA-binding MarR family transcriptional regulator